MRISSKIQKRGSAKAVTWVRFTLSLMVLAGMVYLSFYHDTCVYLLRQGRGQLNVLLNARPLDQFRDLSPQELANLELVAPLKKYSVDSLGYDATSNYNSMYYHGREPVLLVVTASEAYSLEPVYWNFPVVGRVSYKGFFDRRLAAREFERLAGEGFDVEVSPVTAYSSLGWFHDPLFSGMLARNKGAFCNLLFHELFHATYYAAGDVNLNENLASFVAHKATLQFLRGDTVALRMYLSAHADQQILRRYMHRQYNRLKQFYESEPLFAERNRLKSELFSEIADSLFLLPLSSPRRVKSRASQVLSAKNAYFVGFRQYESLQDSIENAFNKFYRRNIKNMVHDLKRK